MNARLPRYDERTATPVLRSMARQNDADAIDTRALARAFWRKRWHIFGASVTVAVIIYALVSQGTPSYTSSSKLMLDIRKTQIVTVDQIVRDIDPSEQIVNSELAVLRSNPVIDRVIAQLTPEQLDMLDPASQRPSLLRRVIGAVKGLMSAPEPAPSPDVAAIQRQVRLVAAVRDAAQVYAERDSYVMVARVSAVDPVLARDIANGLAEGYLSLQIDNRRSSVAQATGWLEDRLTELSQEVELAEVAVTDFQAQSLILDGVTLENVTKQLADLNGQLIEASGARVEAEARLAQLLQMFESSGPQAAARIVDTPVMADLRAKEAELLQLDAVWARTQPATQPRRVAIANELAEVAAAMSVQVGNAIDLRRSEAEVARQREFALGQRIAALDAQVVRINGNQLELRQLQREADAKRTTYESLLARVSDARAQRELQRPDALLIQRAVAPRSPSEPRPKIFAAMGMFVTFAGLSALVFFREIAPVTFRGMRELEAETGLPVLATLPAEPWATNRQMLDAMQKNPFSRYAERVRQLRTALTVGRGGTGKQRILILSSAPGEGKSTTTLAFAQMSALGGASTIVVDCDLRRPRVADALGIAGEMDYDFTDFIQNRCNLGEAVTTSEAYGFDVLAARRADASAADELKTSWLRPMLNSLGEAYDVVLIDAPALLAVPDAMTLVREVDTRLYLVAFDDTPRTAVERGLARLTELGLGVSGLVLNRVDATRSQDALEEGYGYEI